MMTSGETKERGTDWRLTAGFFSTVIAMYAGIGYALYLVVT